jgi:hypothetical protein
MTTKHEGKCTRTCGHALELGVVPANSARRQLVRRDQRVVEWKEIEGRWIVFLYARWRETHMIHYRAK